MEIKARGRRRGSKNYVKEFRTQVVAETLDPARSLSEVARAHGLNANLVSKWRRDQERAAASAASEPAELFLPIRDGIAADAGADWIVRSRHRMSRRAGVFRRQARA